MKKYWLSNMILLVVLLGSLLSGCKQKQEKLDTDLEDGTPTPTVSIFLSSAGYTADPVTEADFDVEYAGKELTADTSVYELQQMFQDNLLEAENIDTRETLDADGTEYKLNYLHYPDMDNEEINIGYLCNVNEPEGKLLCINLLNAATTRGLHVGDDASRVVELYGESLGDPVLNCTDEVFYKIEENGYTLVISYRVDTMKVSSIHYDFGLDAAINATRKECNAETE